MGKETARYLTDIWVRVIAVCFAKPFAGLANFQIGLLSRIEFAGIRAMRCLWSPKSEAVVPALPFEKVSDIGTQIHDGFFLLFPTCFGQLRPAPVVCKKKRIPNDVERDVSRQSSE